MRVEGHRSVGRRLSELFAIDQVAVGAVPERSEDAWVDRLLEELDRAIAEQEVSSPNVPAAEAADEGERQCRGRDAR